MSSLSLLFERFVRERAYLKNVTPKTIIWYETAFLAFERTVHLETPTELNRQTLNDFVVGLRHRGLAAVSCNTYVKALNAFLAWLHAEGETAERFVIPLLRTEKCVVVVLSTDDLRRLLAYKPKTVMQWRAYALASTLLDTGIRIEEALGLRIADIDMENLLMKVRGKGRKERIVPFSFELRRTLYRWTQLTQRQRWASDWCFATRAGTRLGQRNASRAHFALLRRAGLSRSGFHRLRHTFATSYLQNGGDVVRLSRVLGHTQITTTMRYLHLLVSDLQKPHQHLSILNRLR
jgi:integrase/recombinase XerD